MTAIYMISVVVRAVFPDKEIMTDERKIAELEKYSDPTYKMLVPLALFSIATVIFGIWAQPVIDRLSIVANGRF
jgi:multicomponent Na+:H+ antiporter subunit D